MTGITGIDRTTTHGGNDLVRDVLDQLKKRALTEKGKAVISSMIQAHSLNEGGEPTAKEAKDIEAILNIYDKSVRKSLGIEDIRYDDEEIEDALWNDIQDVLSKNDQRGGEDACVNLLKAFILNFPGSRYIQKAYLTLGGVLTVREFDYKAAIEVYENLTKLFPASDEAAEAQTHLIGLCSRIGDYGKALYYAEVWLTRPSYGTASDYAETEKGVLFERAQLYYQTYSYEEAENLYNDVILTANNGGYRDMAEGALYQLYLDTGRTINPGFKKIHQALWGQNYIHGYLKSLFETGQHFQYNERNFEKAKSYYDRILKYSVYTKDGMVEKAKMALAEFGSRAADTPEKISGFLSGLESEGLLNKYFKEYLDVWHENDLPSKLALFIMLYCQNINKTIYLGMSQGIRKADHETKTLSSDYFAVYQAFDGSWRAWGCPGIDPARDRFKDLKEVKGAVQNRLLKIDHNIFISQLSGLPADPPSSLKEARVSNRIDFSPMKLELEKQRLNLRANGALHSFNSTVGTIKGQKTDEELFGIIQAFLLLPKNHFRGLEGLTFEENSSFAGIYYYLDKKISLATRSAADAVHEIIHHWDLNVMLGVSKQPGPDLTKPNEAGDPSNIFYKISWSPENINKEIWGGDFGKVIMDRKGFDENDFANGYGLCNREEDMATSGEDYVFGIDNLSRKAVRQHMKNGNFEPAAKYLFNKYIRSFDPQDKLCFEYNITNDDPVLSLNEVKLNMKIWLARHTNTIAKTTQEAIKEIEKKYVELAGK
jgi:outer membrane protein assembly factor BamD (BamD/ComL family)